MGWVGPGLLPLKWIGDGVALRASGLSGSESESESENQDGIVCRGEDRGPREG